MLESIKGRVLEKTEGKIIIEVNGLGLEVNTPLKNDPYGKGAEIFLYTYLSITQNGVEIYGFKEQEGRNLFKTLIKVPNVGPRTALSIISSLGIPRIKKALSEDDPLPISTVKGIGSKTAKRIILELKDRLKLTTKKAPEEARKALMRLGFLAEEAARSIENVLKDSDDLNSDEIVKRVLKGS